MKERAFFLKKKKKKRVIECRNFKILQRSKWDLHEEWYTPLKKKGRKNQPHRKLTCTIRDIKTWYKDCKLNRFCKLKTKWPKSKNYSWKLQAFLTATGSYCHPGRFSLSVSLLKKAKYLLECLTLCKCITNTLSSKSFSRRRQFKNHKTVIIKTGWQVQTLIISLSERWPHLMPHHLLTKCIFWSCLVSAKEHGDGNMRPNSYSDGH